MPDLQATLFFPLFKERFEWDGAGMESVSAWTFAKGLLDTRFPIHAALVEDTVEIVPQILELSSTFDDIIPYFVHVKNCAISGWFSPMQVQLGKCRVHGQGKYHAWLLLEMIIF